MKKIWIIWILIIAIIAGWSLCEKKPQPIETSWGKVKSLISNGSVKKVEVINRETVLIYLTPEAIEKADTLPVSGAQFSFPIDNTDAFLEEYDHITSAPIFFLVQRSFSEDAPLMGFATGNLVWPILILVIGIVICVLLYRINKNTKEKKA